MGNEGKRDKLWTKNDKVFLGMLIPVLILFFCFNTLPLLKGFYYGLTNYKGYGDFDIVGLRNFKDLITDLRVGKSYLFTRNIFCTEYIGRIGCRLYFQLCIYIHPSGSRGSNRDRVSPKQYACRHQDRLDCHCDCRGMARDCNEYDYLHIRAADSPGRGL